MTIIRLRSAGEYWTDLALAADGVTYEDSHGIAINIFLWRAGCPRSPPYPYLYITGTHSEANDGGDPMWINPQNYIICATP